MATKVWVWSIHDDDQGCIIGYASSKSAAMRDRAEHISADPDSRKAWDLRPHVVSQKARPTKADWVRFLNEQTPSTDNG